MSDSDLVFTALTENCPKFNEDLTAQVSGNLDNQTKFCWQVMLVNSGKSDAAMEFTRANPNHAAHELANLEKFIADAPEKGVKPTRCLKFGCSEDKIGECHNEVRKNADNEASNSPAHFIKEESLNKYRLLEEYDTSKEKVFGLIVAGDTKAHMDEKFIEVVAKVKVNDSAAFDKLKAELNDLNVKLAAFIDEVNEKAKSLSREAAPASKNANLPEILKPYAVGLGYGAVSVSERGEIVLETVNSDGENIIVKLSNFVARITEVLEFDDGITVTQQFVIDGILSGKTKLSTITIDAKDFRSMSWVLKNWGNVLITSYSKATDIVRETIQRVSAGTPITKVHYMIGWKKVDGVWCYLYSSGSIGGENVSVAEITELRGYYFNEYACGAKDCVEYIDKFLNIAPHGITIPLLAHAFLSILIEKLKEEDIEPRYLIWVYGVSGSFKTALTVVLQNLFGNFNSPPATFNDTAAALEKKAYLTKDSLLLVDDFHPSASPQEAKSKASVANGLTRKYGDRITRSRSKSNLSLAKDYPPRGNLICTSEDLLVGHSTNSRHIGIAINRGDINAEILTELQNNKEKMNAFMCCFIQHVAETIMNNPSVTYKAKFQDYRSKSQNSNHHRRFAEAIACLQIGWEAFLDFLKHIGHIDETKHQAYFDEGFKVFQDLAKRQNDLVQNDDIADKFMTALKELIDTKQVIPQNKNLPSTLSKGTTICYADETYYYFVPQTTYATVAEFFAKKGDLLNVNEYMLRKMLADKKYLVESSDGDGHRTNRITVGLQKIRVLQISQSILNTF